QAIVVLGGGENSGLEYHQARTVNERTLLRLRYAAKLARDTGLPVLVSGGKVFQEEYPPEAQLMAEVLQNEFHIPVKWQEPSSRNTAENARFSRQLLQTQAMDKILLVTQAFHIPRAVWSFQNAGFQVLAAPTAFFSGSPSESPLRFIPSANALEKTFLVLHEYLGLLWYRLNSPVQS
ncbi:YdcF family protein, partial [Methylovulum sp.]